MPFLTLDGKVNGGTCSGIDMYWAKHNLSVWTPDRPWNFDGNAVVSKSTTRMKRFVF